MPSLGRGLILAAALLAALPTSAGAAPSCAEGPQIVEGEYIGTPCDDVIRMPRSVTVAHGGDGDDTIFGQRGNDRLWGDGGNDRLYGGIGDDQLHGGEGDDLLSGGFGADSALDGEAGDDLVRGDATIDQIQNTGGGTDTLSYATGVTPGFFDRPDPPHSFPDFSAYDGFPQSREGRGVYVDLGPAKGDNGRAPEGGGFDEQVAGAAFDVIVGTPFDDYLVGTAAPETFFGGGGADVILGGGGGDQIYGGSEGDYCDPDEATLHECESSSEKKVEPREASEVSAGVMAPQRSGDPPALYLKGSNASDTVSAAYSSDFEHVSFDLGSGSEFDVTSTGDGGCEVLSATEATCPAEQAPDSIVIAGLGGEDWLSAPGFPSTTSLVLLGGNDGDHLTGGDTEDALVDGPGNDTAMARGGDDAVPNNEGADDLDAGAGEDLFVSDAVCDGDSLDGGPDRDNANWANFDEGVTIDMDAERAGRVGPEGQAQCSSAALLTEIANLEDIEGSSFGDVMVGDSGPNQLLGRSGADSYFAAAGNDHILANSGDADTAIECGEGFDTALVDHPEHGDPDPVECESVEARNPNSFRPPDTPPDPDPEPEEPSDDGEEPVTSPPPPPVPPLLLDRTPPQTWFAHRPPRRVFTPRRWRRVAFVFTSNEPARYLCKLDNRALHRCGRVRRFGVRPGRHALRVRAIDLAGNPDRSVALHRFVVRRVSAR